MSKDLREAQIHTRNLMHSNFLKKQIDELTKENEKLKKENEKLAKNKINKHRLANTEDYLLGVYNYICDKKVEKKNEIMECSDTKKLRDLCYELIFLCEQEKNLDVVFNFIDDLKSEVVKDEKD